MNTLQSLFIILNVYGVCLYHVYAQRYVIDNDSDLPGYVAFPIDVCFQNKFGETTSYLQYTCSGDGSIVTKTSYSDASCTTQTATSTFDNNTDSSPCGGPKFSCSGSRDTDEYVDTGLYVDVVTQSSCALSLGSIPNVLGCYCDTDSSSYKL